MINPPSRSAFVLASLGLLAACSDNVDAPTTEATGVVRSAWTEYPGTPTFAAGWQLRQVFEGNKDVWAPSYAGAFVRDSTGWTYAFPELENGSILGATTSAAGPIQVDLTTKLLGYFVGGATTSRGPAVLYDRYYWQRAGGSGSWVSDAIRLARLGPGGWTSELVDDQFSPNVLEGLCLANRGDSLTAFYNLGAQVLKVADEQAAGGWDVRTLVGNDARGAGPFGCAGGTDDLWFVLGEDVFDEPRVARLRAGDAAPEEVTLLPIGPRLRAASTAVGADDVPVVAYFDESVLRLATRIAPGNWNIETVPTPFRADEVSNQNITLSLESGSPVLAITRYGEHPPSPGVGKDEIWLLRKVDGAWRATEVYSPPGGWLRIHGMVVDGDHVVLGAAHSKYAGPYRNVIIEGPLP